MLYKCILKGVGFCCYGNSDVIDLFKILTFNYIPPDALECAVYALNFR